MKMDSNMQLLGAAVHLICGVPIRGNSRMANHVRKWGFWLLRRSFGPIRPAPQNRAMARQCHGPSSPSVASDTHKTGDFLEDVFGCVSELNLVS